FHVSGKNPFLQPEHDFFISDLGHEGERFLGHRAELAAVKWLAWDDAEYMRPSNQTMAVGDLYSFTPAGSVPFQPGPVIAYVCGPVPVVRLPGTWKTVVQPSSMGNR
ncbi:MAG TPA: hypothetical protein VFG19_11300, partial [Geobacteraceae bacterium]|nr:hypothetical protein [Geobacteraceae bacterium]